jgi:PAS domain S-box-containing protein
MNKQLRILILEDQPADADLVRRELRKAGFEFVAKEVATEQEFLAELRNFAPQLILADYSLPGYDGLSALAAAQKQCPEAAFIFVSGSLGEERAIDTLRCGATDYVLKERLVRLGPAVHRALRERKEMRKGRQAEKERRESEEQLRAMFELASIGMAQADPRTGQWLRVNQKLCAITGYSAAEMLQMRVPELTHPDDRQKDGEQFARVVRGEAPDYRLEKRYVRKDGTLVWVNVNMTVIRDAAGQPTRTMATIEDITERKRVEEWLYESERRFRLLFNSGYDAVFVHQGSSAGNGSGKFIEVNEIACRRLGYTREELLQMTPRDISAPETLPDVPGIRAKLAVDKSAISEGVHVTKDGRRIPVEISTHIFKLNGKPTRLSAVRDITERKQAEAALRESSQFNQQIVASAQEGIIVIGRDLKYQVWNPFMERLTGMPADQVLGKHID